jgi:hypothetical protein
VKAAIPLGIEVDDKLQFSIGKDKVYLRFSETTKEVPHQLTKQEKMALLEYEDAKKQKRWAREPQIRKYDHVYTGTLSLGINDKRRFRDSRLGQIEDRLGEVLVAIFYCINEAKLAREEREEAERKREEERRRQEEIKKRYNEEVAKTKALLNQANDFEIATKIRAMAAAAEANGSASKEQVAEMLRRILSLNLDDVNFLDATDALGVAYCHYMETRLPKKASLSKPSRSGSRAKSWADFAKNNADRVRG